MVDGGASEEIGAERRSSPTIMKAGGADGRSGSADMMDAVPLGMVEGSVTSTHREMERQIRWDDIALEALGKGLDRTSREEQKGARTEIVGNELHGNKVSQEVTEKRYGPTFKEDEILSPIGPKGKGGLSEDKESRPVIREAEVLSPLRLKGKESSSEVRGSQPQSRGWLCKRVVRGKIKSMAREKGKTQNIEKSEQAREVSKKRKVNYDMLFVWDDRVQKHFCEEKHGDGVNSFIETVVTAEQHRLD